MKKILGIYSAPRSHWVGDGFPVRSLFSYDSHGKHLSPFLLLDYAGPAQFAPTTQPRGVGQHPHRGFETVTIVYSGELEHRDSTGSGGLIGPGDVQWMTAAGGIVHEEFHSPAFTRSGGQLEMVQLWVNLPAKDKMAEPRYQTLLDRDIPSAALADAGGSLIRLHAGKAVSLNVPEQRTTALVVLRGEVLISGTQIARDAQLVLLERAGVDVVLEANSDAVILLLDGEPIDEPIVGYGPFVMNTQAEIRQAITDFESGHFGHMHA